MAFQVGTETLEQSTSTSAYVRYINTPQQTATPEIIEQETATSAYVRYINTPQQTATPEIIEQETATSGYLRYINTPQQTATPEIIEQETATSGYLRYKSLSFQTSQIQKVKQKTKITAFIFYRPFFASGADIIPLYQVTPQFHSLPGEPIDGFPTKGFSETGNQTETKLASTEEFTSGTNSQGVPKPDIVKEWGKLFIAIDKQDVTLFRDSEAIINSISWSMLGNYETLEIIIPAATSYDTKLTLEWLYSGALIEIYKEKDDIFDIIWRGSVNGWEFLNEGVGLKLTANGLIYDLTYQIATPQKEIDYSKDIAYYIREIINSGKHRFNPMREQYAGRTIKDKASYENELDYIKKLNDSAFTTLWIDKYDTPRIALKDERVNSSVDPLPIKVLRYINGQDGLSDNLRNAQLEEGNVIYQTGRYENGGNWANWVYPQINFTESNKNLVDYPAWSLFNPNPTNPYVPTAEMSFAFPLADISSKVEIGTTDSETMLISDFPSTADGRVNFTFTDENGETTDIQLSRKIPQSGNGIITLQYMIARYILGLSAYINTNPFQSLAEQFPSLKEGNVGTFQESDSENIKIIQRQNGLPDTGEVDIKTWSALCGKEDIASDAWIAPSIIILSSTNGRLNEKYEDLGTTKRVIKSTSPTQEDYEQAVLQNQPVGGQGITTATPNIVYYGDEQMIIPSGTTGEDLALRLKPNWIGEIELTLCPPIVENGGELITTSGLDVIFTGEPLFGNGEISRFDINPRDIIEIYYHPGSYTFVNPNPRYLDLFITRVEWNLSREPKVKLQVSTKPFSYEELAEKIYPDL